MVKHTPNSMLCYAAPPHGRRRCSPAGGPSGSGCPRRAAGRAIERHHVRPAGPRAEDSDWRRRAEADGTSRESSPELTQFPFASVLYRESNIVTALDTRTRSGDSATISSWISRMSSTDGTPERLGHRQNVTLRRPIVFSLRSSKFGKESADCLRVKAVVSKACTPGTLTSDVTPGGVPWSVG